jgi:hypothetical protein
MDIWDDGMSDSTVRRFILLLTMLVMLALSLACFGSGSHQIAFVSEVDGESEIFLLEPETGETTPRPAIMPGISAHYGLRTESKLFT